MTSSAISNWERYRRKFMRVEIVLCLGTFCSLLLAPLQNEYVYKVLKCDRWLQMFDLCLYVPASVMSILLTSWSDRVGRKVILSISLAGQSFSSAWMAVTIHFDWPLKALYLSHVIAGMTGYLMTMMIQGCAYLSDITTVETRGFRFVILETCIGLGGGAAGVCSGFWIQSEGFVQPTAVAAGLLAVALVLVPVLPNERKIRRELSAGGGETTRRMTNGSSGGNSYGGTSYDEDEQLPARFVQFQEEKKKTYKEIAQSMKHVYFTEWSRCSECFGDYDPAMRGAPSSDYRCRHGGGRYPGRVWKIWSYLVTYNGIMAALVGSMGVQTIYFMSKPLCFSRVEVGLQQGLRYGATTVSPLLVLLYQKVLHLSSDVIILISLFGFTTFYLLVSFAQAGWIVFLGTAIAGLAMAGKAFNQSQLSSLVSESEYGVAFALLSCTESVNFLVSSIAFLAVYRSTLKIYRGIVWFAIAGALLLPICLMLNIIVRQRNLKETPHNHSEVKDQEKKPLLS